VGMLRTYTTVSHACQASGCRGATSAPQAWGLAVGHRVLDAERERRPESAALIATSHGWRYSSVATSCRSAWEVTAPVWQELYGAAAGTDIEFVWRNRDQSPDSELAHQLARDPAKRP
jgi:hypothetical protein